MRLTGISIEVDRRFGAFRRYGIYFTVHIRRVDPAERIIRMGKDDLQFFKGPALFEIEITREMIGVTRE
jgi:hypothetical protein